MNLLLVRCGQSYFVGQVESFPYTYKASAVIVLTDPAEMQLVTFPVQGTVAGQLGFGTGIHIGMLPIPLLSLNGAQITAWASIQSEQAGDGDRSDLVGLYMRALRDRDKLIAREQATRERVRQN